MLTTPKHSCAQFSAVFAPTSTYSSLSNYAQSASLRPARPTPSDATDRHNYHAASKTATLPKGACSQLETQLGEKQALKFRRLQTKGTIEPSPNAVSLLG